MTTYTFLLIALSIGTSSLLIKASESASDQPLEFPEIYKKIGGFNNLSAVLNDIVKTGNSDPLEEGAVLFSKKIDGDTAFLAVRYEVPSKKIKAAHVIVGCDDLNAAILTGTSIETAYGGPIDEEAKNVQILQKVAVKLLYRGYTLRRSIFCGDVEPFFNKTDFKSLDFSVNPSPYMRNTKFFSEYCSNLRCYWLNCMKHSITSDR